MRAPTRVFWILEISNTKWNNLKDYSRRSRNAFSYIGCMKPLPSDNKVRLSAETSAVNTRSELLLPAHSVEKHRVVGAESGAQVGARAPFLSGFSRLLRCRKDLGQFAEVLGCGGEQEFVVCTTWAT